MTSDQEIRPSGANLYRIAWAIYLLLAIAGAVWLGIAGRADGGLRLELFVSTETWGRDLLWGLGAGLALLAFWEVGRRLLPSARELERAIADILAGLSPSDALGLALLSGFAEEIFFRGAVQGQWGLWVATVLFALLHTGPGRPFYLWTAFAAVAGLVFGLLAAQLGNLLAPIVAHVLVNAVNLRRLALHPPATGEAAGPR